MATLDLINLRKEFGTVVAVNNINLNVGDGEFLCFLGPSGCGKSTALRMVGGFEEPTSGDVQIDGASVVQMSPNRRPTAMVFQKFTLWPHMRVYDNIAFGLRLRRMPNGEIDKKVNGALEMVGLKAYGKRYPTQLSGGEQQRVALARAIVLEPKILLLDEPFSNLDALLRVRLREELRMIQRNIHITAIFVTHDQEEALSLADRIAVMNKGQIEQLDKPSQIYSSPRTLFVADFIGAMNILPATRAGDHVQIGERGLPAPDGLTNGPLTVAIRPEDIAIVPATSTNNGTWPGQITQLSDLGHYRKAFVDVAGIGALKLYLPKSTTVDEGDAVTLYPTRYLVYPQDKPPVEVKRTL
ncbi:MAG: ABC transporter ATP-binding protein [Chloroflexi bacterium]|nr:ABC transporter ATP-binding protein [Chloroflexota bacterium]